MNWLIKLLLAVVAQCLTAVLDIFSKILNGIFIQMYELQESINISSAISTCRGLGLSFVAIFTLKQLINMYVLENEEMDEDVFALFTRVCETIATIECGTIVIEELIHVAGLIYDKVTTDLILPKDDSGNDSFLGTLGNIVSHVVADSTVVAFVLVLFLGVAIIVFVIVTLKAAKRGAELILFQMLLPFIALSKLGKNREMWHSFINQIMITIFGYIIQLIGYIGFGKALSMYGESNAFSADNILYLLAGMGWLLVTLSAPKWLDKFVSQSGISQMAKSSLSSVGQAYLNGRLR